MTEKQRLVHALFGHPEREHRNIKFFRGTSADVSVEKLCREAANGIEQITTGLVDAVSTRDTLDHGYRERPLSEIVAAL